ncbi:hypothetical protein HAZELMIKA_6 [Klebsiella phage vB_KaeD_HazelMika]|nr:hypothetical protein HAZELMIKA_6 [Klebsiella phage vB_KaeD_HazelMika]
MALIKASWTVRRSKAYAGMTPADTSLYNIDGTCCSGVPNLKAGVIVALDATQKVVDGHKVVTNVIDTGAANPKLVGATIMSHAYSPEGFYDEGSAVNVITHGRAWVLCKKDLTDENKEFGNQVFVDADGIVSNSGAGVIGTVYTATGEWFKTDDANYDIVKIQITQAQFQLPAAGGA